MDRLVNFFKRVWGLTSVVLSGLGRLFARHKIKLAVAAVVLLAVFATLPSPGSLLILHRNVETEPEADRIVRRSIAEANARNFATNHVRQLLNKDFVVQGDLTEKFGIDRIDDILDGSLGFEKTEGFWQGRLGVDVTTLLRSLVDGYFSEPSTMIIVDDYIVDLDGTSRSAIILTANRVTTREIQGDHASADSLVGNVAEFIATFFFDRSENCDLVFCARHFPREASDIKRVSDIIEALAGGKVLGVCRDIDDELMCLTQVQQELDALGEEFLVKDILLLLTQLSNLKVAIERSQASAEIGDTLDRLHRQLLRVKRVPQFNHITTSDETLQHFLSSVGKEDLELNLAFLTSVENYQTGRLAAQSGDPAKAMSYFRKVEQPPSWFKGYLSGVTLGQAFDPHLQDVATSLEFIENLLSSNFEAEYIRKGLAGILFRQLIEARKEDLSEVDPDDLAERLKSIWSDAVSSTSSEQDRLGAQIEQARALHALQGGQTGRLTELISKLKSEQRDVSYRNAYMSAAMFAATLSWTDKTRDLLEYAFELYPRNICGYNEQFEFISFKAEMGDEYDEWFSNQRTRHKPPC